MANRPKGYGFSPEYGLKIDDRYSDEQEIVIVDWISAIVKSRPEGTGKQAFHAWLKDGIVLCKLMNEIVPDSCRPNNPITSTNQAWANVEEMENIGIFLNAASAYGVKSSDLFETNDLHEAGNLAQVQTAMFQLSSTAHKNRYGGPKIGFMETN